MKIRTYRITLQFLVFVALNLGLIIGFYGIVTPFFYCHACPLADSLCPIGAIQYSLKTSFLLLLYVLGTLSLVAVIFGRASCGWGCPIGSIQDLTMRVAKYKRIEIEIINKLKYLKYIVLIATIILSYAYIRNAFTNVCPIGFLTATVPTIALFPGLFEPINPYFTIKLIFAIVFIIMIIFISRAWCRYICPLGAYLSLFNKASLIKIKYIRENCTSCKLCLRSCPVGIDPRKDTESIECIRCGRCVDECLKRALKFSIRKIHDS